MQRTDSPYPGLTNKLLTPRFTIHAVPMLDTVPICMKQGPCSLCIHSQYTFHAECKQCKRSSHPTKAMQAVPSCHLSCLVCFAGCIFKSDLACHAAPTFIYYVLKMALDLRGPRDSSFCWYFGSLVTNLAKAHEPVNLTLPRH